MELRLISLGGKEIRFVLDRDDGDVTVEIDDTDDFIIQSDEVSKVIQWLSDTRSAVSALEKQP